MFVVIGQDDYFRCSDDYALREVEKSPLRPVRTQELDGLPQRLFTRAMADGQENLAHGISVPVRTRRLSRLRDGLLRGGAGGCQLDSVTDPPVRRALPRLGPRRNAQRSDLSDPASMLLTMTSVNVVNPRARTSRCTTGVPGPVSGNASRSSAAALEVIPLWAAPHAAVPPATRRR